MRFVMLTLCFLCTLAHNSFAGERISLAASAMGREIDRQVAERLQQSDTPAQGVSLFLTTPVSINDLTLSNPLARQMQEELARWFVQAGYKVQEIRKGGDLLFDPATGELLLTRNTELLGTVEAKSAAVLVGTYAVTGKTVRFNVRLVHTATQEVLGMSTLVLPIDPEVAALLHTGSNGGGGNLPIEPTVVTRLP